MGWRYKDGSKISVSIKSPLFTMNGVVLPLLSNMDESSEESIIQLYEIYRCFYDYVEGVLKGSAVESTENLPYKVVKKLDFMSELLYGYVKIFNLHKFGLEPMRINLDPTEATPTCQYMLESVVDCMNNIQRELFYKDIILDD